MAYLLLQQKNKILKIDLFAQIDLGAIFFATEIFINK